MVVPRSTDGLRGDGARDKLSDPWERPSLARIGNQLERNAETVRTASLTTGVAMRKAWERP